MFGVHNIYTLVCLLLYLSLLFRLPLHVRCECCNVYLYCGRSSFLFVLFFHVVSSTLSTFSIYMLHLNSMPNLSRRYLGSVVVDAIIVPWLWWRVFRNNRAVGNHVERQPFAFGRPDSPAMAAYTCRYRSSPFHPSRSERQLGRSTCNMLHVVWSMPYLKMKTQKINHRLVEAFTKSSK